MTTTVAFWFSAHTDLIIVVKTSPFLSLREGRDRQGWMMEVKWIGGKYGSAIVWPSASGSMGGMLVWQPALERTWVRQPTCRWSTHSRHCRCCTRYDAACKHPDWLDILLRQDRFLLIDVIIHTESSCLTSLHSLKLVLAIGYELQDKGSKEFYPT